MKKSMMRFPVALAVAAAVAATLVACGGDGDDDSPAVTEEVPLSASQSIGGFIAYLKELVNSSADTLEPVDISTVVAPTDETSEPDPSI